MTTSMNRRQLLYAAAGAAATVACPRRAVAAGAKPSFMIVVGCFGGASILDSFMALAESEVRSAGGDPEVLNCFPDQQVVTIPGSPFRAVDLELKMPDLKGYKVATKQSDFLRKHWRDMLVVTLEGTSVNHGIAQTRSLTGNDAWRGKTVQECVAEQFGSRLPIANLNMGAGGFGVSGHVVANPQSWPLALSGHHGVAGAPDAAAIALARGLRRDGLEAESPFARAFSGSKALREWQRLRDEVAPSYESEGLLQKLAPDEALLAAFPNHASDELEAQALLAFAAIARGISCAVTLGPTGTASGEDLRQIFNLPLGFDFSHQDHRGAQAHMWQRVLGVVDRLIDRLKALPLADGSGESHWDRTTIYLATDFGRDKLRPRGAARFSTGHHLNNGIVVLSPRANGGRILGGVDPTTGLTFGFDSSTGAPAPERVTAEREIFAGLLGIAGVDTGGSGLPDVKCMRKA